MSVQSIKTSAAGSPGVRLAAVGLTKSFGADRGVPPVFADLDFAVNPQEIVCIVGPSGVGKTTLLRCCAGLEEPTGGTVSVNDRVVVDTPSEVGLVFQDYSRSLMPWMTASDNVAFPLRGQGVAKKARAERAQQALEQVGLGGALRKYPWQMSGGMQQRVAIARALAYGAPLLLMDEPFASVDAQTRFELEDLLLVLRRTAGISIMLVTHDIDEAVYLSDRVIVLSGAPASVVDVVDVNLGRDRNQIQTKARPEFATLRTRVMEGIDKGRIRTGTVRTVAG